MSSIIKTGRLIKSGPFEPIYIHYLTEMMSMVSVNKRAESESDISNCVASGNGNSPNPERPGIACLMNDLVRLPLL